MKTRIHTLVAAALVAAHIADAQDAPSALPVQPVEPHAGNAARWSARSAQLAQVGDTYSIMTSSYSGSSVPPVVIQFAPAEPAAISAMEEHLAIMTRVIDRALERTGESDVDERLGVKLYYTGGKSVRAIYLEGAGPLFMVKVNFPVHSPGAAEPRVAGTTENSEWKAAQNELFGQDRLSQKTSSSSSAVPYVAARVEALKTQLIAVLKHASNMSGVKPDEYINVSVFGSPAAIDGNGVGHRDPSPTGVAPARRTVSSGRASANASDTSLEIARSTLQGTVLALRVKKSDVDAAAKGTLDADAFAKKVAVNTYGGNGHGLTSVNSWIRGSSSSGLRVR